jgi:hypothetical protein
MPNESYRVSRPEAIVLYGDALGEWARGESVTGTLPNRPRRAVHWSMAGDGRPLEFVAADLDSNGRRFGCKSN